MTLIKQQISEKQYNELDYPILFDDNKFDRAFGIIDNGKYQWKYGWQSISLKPFIENLEAETYLIGIDRDFIIVDLSSNIIKLKLRLNYFFYGAKQTDKLIFVISELEVIKIVKTNFEIIQSYELPDFFQDMKIMDEHCKITYSGGGSIIIPNY